MSLASKKVPVAFVTGVICLGLGIGGGIVVANYMDSEKKAQTAQDNANAGTDPMAGKGMPGAPGGKGAPGGGKGGFGGGKGGFGGGKGGNGPGGAGGGGRGFFGPQMQLTQLVTRLDALTKKPLTVELTADDKKQILQQLEGVDTGEPLSEQDTQKKLDAILAVVEKHRATLEAAGFRWPGQPFTQPPDNPLKEGEGNEHLKSLRATLGK